ncbi:MAG TPA: serpin family protein [Puia sp.]|nr:serpin family protein [Puia sp.]
MKKFFPAGTVLLVIVLLPSYGQKMPLAERSVLARGSNRFAFTLMRAMLKDTTNRLVSPMGVYLSLNLLYNGAAGDTRDSIGQALQVMDINIHQLNALSKNLVQQFSMTDKLARFSIANGIWCNRKKLKLTPAFGELADTWYYSAVQALPFNGRAAAEKINGWTKQNTDRRFPHVLESTRPGDLVYLTNACSFSCGWRHPFNAANTQMDLFYLAGGGRTTVPFMHKVLAAGIYSDTSFTMIELPYGNGNAYGLFLVLPDDTGQTIRTFTSFLAQEKFYAAISRMNPQWVDLSLPRWEQTYDTTDLQPALEQSGLGILFNKGGASDLSNMCSPPGGGMQGTPVSRYYHTAGFTINEKGSLADDAATTDTGTMSGMHRTLNLKFDHPFLYFVIAKQQQVVLFSGVLNNPAVVHPAPIITKLAAKSPSRPAGPRLPHGIGHRGVSH